MLVRLSLLLLLTMLGGLVCWTQTLARTYGYHPALGEALWEVKPWRGLVYPFYGPWKALVWQWQWGETSGTWLLAGSAGLALLLAGLVWWGWQGLPWTPIQGRESQPPPLEGHGTGKWATKRDVKKAGLL